MEDADRQLELWTLLGQTRVVTDATGTALTPWQAGDRSDEAPGRADAQKKGRGATTLDLGKVPAGRTACSDTPYAQAGEAKSKAKARIAPARYGNRHVLIVPRFRS